MSDLSIDTVPFFDVLADKMNAHPERYEVLGDVELDLILVMRRPDGADFRVRLVFTGITCDGVALADEGDHREAHCSIEGPIEAWQAMFDDIAENGRAEGRQTLNALNLGDVLVIEGADPMGTDRVSRFNQTLQQFFDGAGRPAEVAAVT
jgi:hypothetical protein